MIDDDTLRTIRNQAVLAAAQITVCILVIVFVIRAVID